MPLTLETERAIKEHGYGMYTVDGDLRVAAAIINDLEHGTPLDDLWERMKRIQAAVLESESHWCPEVIDTAVEEAIYLALKAFLPQH